MFIPVPSTILHLVYEIHYLHAFFTLNIAEILLISRNHNAVISSFMTYHRVCNKPNTTSVPSGAETSHPSWAPKFIPGFKWARVSRVFCVVFWG